MLNIVNHFTAHVETTEEAPARDIKVFITDSVLDYKDKAVLKHLVNSNVDIMGIRSMKAARAIAEELDAEGKLVTSQKDVNIRYRRWSLAKNDADSDNSESDVKETKPCEEPSIGPDHVYNQKLADTIAESIIRWCRRQKFQSFLPYGMLHVITAEAIYGRDVKKFDKHQLAVIKFVKERFAERYCVVSPFNKNGYNIGSELMLCMYPEGVRYRKERYTGKVAKEDRTYFILLPGKMVNQKTKEVTMIPDGTFLTRSEERLRIDRNLYYSNRA